MATTELTPYLDLGIGEIDFDEYTNIEDDDPETDLKHCYYCNYKFKSGTAPIDSFLHKTKKIIKTCVLCNIIVNFKGKNVEDCLVYISKTSQLDIITKTIKYIEKHKKMPSVADIDKNAKRVEISSFHFVQYLSDVAGYGSLKENYKIINKEQKKEYKLFFAHSKIIYNFFGLEGYSNLAMVDDGGDQLIKFHDEPIAFEDYILTRLFKDSHMKERKIRTRTILKYVNMCYDALPQSVKNPVLTEQ